LHKILPFPAMCMVEISGAVRQGLSGFERAAHFLGHNNPRAILDKDVGFISKGSRCTDPAAKPWLV
jgi:hypothetical protein